MAESGGPLPQEYQELEGWFREVRAEVQAGILTPEDVRTLWDVAGDAFSVNTMQGFVVRKPHGHPGDYEMLDGIHTERVSPDPNLANWDRFFHSRPAAKAVRNRQAYLSEILAGLEAKVSDAEPRVLDVASGPARLIHDYLSSHRRSRVHFDCVDMDPKAIYYAKQLCRSHSSQITFHCQNITKFRTLGAYDLIWSAGLFDYMTDKHFGFLLRKLYALVAPGGQLVVGNFSPANPTRAYMEFGEWFINHRDEDQLKALAKDNGVPLSAIRVGAEAEGVNLFLHLRKEEGN